MIIKSARTILHLLHWHEIHLIWCFIWCAIFQFQLSWCWEMSLASISLTDLHFIFTRTHTHIHAWSGSKANISITCNWAPLTDPANTVSTTTNYMFWLLTPGHRQFLPRKSFLTLPIGDLFVFHFDFFCLELGPVIVPVSVPVPDLVSSVALESVATFRLLAKWLYCADRGSVIGDRWSFRCQEPTAPMGNNICELFMRLTPTGAKRDKRNPWNRLKVSLSCDCQTHYLMYPVF